jgi:CBS domain containing-hemolysin-like protein
MYYEFLGILVLLLCSAYFSATEMAYITSNKLKLELKSKKNNISSRTLKYFLYNPQDFYSTILLGNNLINIAFASLSALLFSRIFNLNEFEILITTTILILFFGEIIPKYLASEFADGLINILLLFLRTISILFSPIVKLLSLISNKILDIKKSQQENLTLLYDREDILNLIEESHSAGKVLKREKNILQRAIELGKQKIYECMRPRTEIIGINIDSSILELKKLFLDSGYSKIVIYEKDLDNIVGFVLLKDLFSNPNEIKEIIREIRFYPETKKSIEVLNEMIENKLSIGVVVDEFGGTAGIVTTEDIIEELFGEIKDEYDEEEIICKRISKSHFLVSGKVEIDYFNEKYDLNLPEGEYETIAGLVEFHIGKIPKVGETFKIDKYNFIIIKATNTRIELVKIIFQDE